MIGSAQLGTENATPGNIEPGYITQVAGPLIQVWQDNLALTEQLTVFSGVIKFSDTLVFTDSFHNKNTKKAFTDVLHLIQRFDVSVSPQTNLNDLLFFQETWIVHKTLVLTLSDVLPLSDGPSFNYRFDRYSIPVPTFQILKNKPPAFVTLSSLRSAIVLDSPLFGDSEASLNETKILMTVGGKRYSYNKTLQRRHLKYDFNMRVKKYIELKSFLDTNNLEWMSLTNWKAELWSVLLVNNPIEYEAISRDWYSVSLEFQGYKICAGDYRCLE